MLTGGRSTNRIIMATMWLVVAVMAIAGALSVSPSPPDLAIRVAASAQFILWPLLIWLVVVLTNNQITLVPMVITGIWIFMLLVSLQVPVENLYITLPETTSGSSNRINEWWYSAYFAIMVTLGYCLYICYRFYRNGDAQAARVLTGVLVLLLETAIFDLLVTLRLIDSPTVTVFGFFVVLAVLSYYLAPRLRMEQPAPEPEQTITPGDTSQPLAGIQKTLKEVQIYSGMGLRRIKRGAHKPDKLYALFERVHTDATTELNRLEKSKKP
ncbi:MAG: hypothetical protein V3V12_03355 [Gammaproteobacteria bacterium]